MRALVIDDSRSSLEAILSRIGQVEDCAATGLLDPEEALDLCRREQFDLVLVDYIMPKMNGLEVLKALREMEGYKSIPIIVVTAYSDRELRREAVRLGATDFLTKPFDWVEIEARTRNLLDLRKAHIQLADRAMQLSQEVAAAVRHLTDREEEVIWRLARAVEFRDGTTGDHISRVATISRLVAEGLGLDAEKARMIYLAAPLHDIGKIAISDFILRKPGRLTEDEFAQMREHVVIGSRILGDGSSTLIRTAAVIAESHHEKWDGSGYPLGLAGEDIPIEGRIVAIADVFDALCSERPYKAAWPPEKARAEIVAQSGLHFDPACVSAFEAKWTEIEALVANSGP